MVCWACLGGVLVVLTVGGCVSLCGGRGLGVGSTTTIAAIAANGNTAIGTRLARVVLLNVSLSVVSLPGSLAGNPFDVLKTKMMAAEGEGMTLSSVARAIYKSQGLAGFYKGMDANILRAMVTHIGTPQA